MGGFSFFCFCGLVFLGGYIICLGGILMLLDFRHQRAFLGSSCWKHGRCCFYYFFQGYCWTGFAHGFDVLHGGLRAQICASKQMSHKGLMTFLPEHRTASDPASMVFKFFSIFCLVHFADMFGRLRNKKRFQKRWYGFL